MERAAPGPETFPVMKSKVAIVTGAAMGMGEATARLFAQAGAKVVLADFTPRRARRSRNRSWTPVAKLPLSAPTCRTPTM